jgi:hypothetical protein
MSYAHLQFLGAAAWIILVSGGTSLAEQSVTTVPRTVQFCDLVQNPEIYDGQRVTVRAVYNYGFEWQELLCMECHIRGKTWLQFDSDTAKQVRKGLRKAPRHQGIIIADFTGIFHAKGGPYGDGSYRYSFEVEAVENMKVLAKCVTTSISAVGRCRAETQ